MKIPGFVVALLAVGLVTVMLFGGSGFTLLAQGDTRKRVDALEAGQKEILKELQDIKAILQGRGGTAPANAQAAAPSNDITLNIANAPSRGKADAKVVLVEFSDFECPFCGRYTRETEGQVVKNYVDTGKVRYVYRHMPLERLHPHAMRAAEAGECARAQNKFWELHQQLFTNQQALTDADLTRHAQAVGVNVSTFSQCMEGQATAKVRQDLSDGARAGISGTPTFFVGTVGPDGQVKVMNRLVGAAPYASFEKLLDEALAKAS